VNLVVVLLVLFIDLPNQNTRTMTTIQISATTQSGNLTWNDSDFSSNSEFTLNTADKSEFDRAVLVASQYLGIKSVSIVEIDWQTGESTLLFNQELK
jgi:uncharacterized protein YjdB